MVSMRGTLIYRIWKAMFEKTWLLVS